MSNYRNLIGLAVAEYFESIGSMSISDKSNAAPLIDLENDAIKFLVDTLAIYIDELSDHYGESILGERCEAIVGNLKNIGICLNNVECPVSIAVSIVLIESRGQALIDVSINKTPFDEVVLAIENASNGNFSSFLKEIQKRNTIYSTMNSSSMVV